MLILTFLLIVNTDWETNGKLQEIFLNALGYSW